MAKTWDSLSTTKMGSRSPGKMEPPAACCTATPSKGWKCLLMTASEICIWILVVLRENWPWTCTLVRSRLYLCCTRSCRPKSRAWDCLYEQQESEKSLECHKKYFHLKKKKKIAQKESSLLSSSTVPWQGPANHCWTPTTFKEEPAFHKLPRPEFLGSNELQNEAVDLSLVS